MSKERLAAAAEEADEFLDSLTAPPEEETPVGGIVPEGHQSEDEPAPTAAPEAGIDTLRTEIDRLRSQLQDENNPSWRAKYNTLQGMFNRLNEEVKELKERKAEPSPPAVPKADEKLVKRLAESFGEEEAATISQLIEERAQQIAAQNLTEQLKPYTERIDRVEQTQVQTKEQGFFAALSTTVPDWKKINGWESEGIGQQPQFAQFLDQTVPATDYTYNDLLQYHYKNGNVNKTAEIFSIYKATQGTTEPEKPKTKGVEQYVDPGKTQKGTAPPDSTQQKTYSLVDIDRFYDSVTKGSFRGTYEERQALEKEYHQAIIEGRVK